MKEREKRLSHERLREVLRYDAITGVFTWAKRTSNRVAVGAVAGQVDRNGHRMINVDGLRYMAHRLAWFYFYGRWPVDEIDHRNLRKDENWIDNLREATHTENVRNVIRRKNNKTGFKGVIRHSQARDKFMAQITLGGVPKYLGLFDDPKTAHEAYMTASAKYHGEFGRPE